MNEQQERDKQGQESQSYNDMNGSIDRNNQI